MAILEKRKSVPFFVIDTPGQIEAFTWSASGTIITDTLASTFPTCIAYVVDSARAENPTTFRPSPGKIRQYHPPGGLGVRIDSAVYQGYAIPPYYDSLVGKLIVHGKSRSECLMRLRRALDEMVVDGIETTLPLFRALVREPAIIDGDYHIHWLEQYLAGQAGG